MRILSIAAVAALLTSGFAYAGESETHPTQTEPWTISEMNEVVNDANFIVGTGCSGTLINIQEGANLVLTAQHCVKQNIQLVRTKEIVNGEAKETEREVLRDITVSQKIYTGSRS